MCVGGESSLEKLELVYLFERGLIEFVELLLPIVIFLLVFVSLELHVLVGRFGPLPAYHVRILVLPEDLLLFSLVIHL